MSGPDSMGHAYPLAGRTILATTIKGPPVQWARARVGGGAETGVGRQRSFHTAPAQKRYKNLVRDEGRLAMLTAKARRLGDGKPVPLGTPVIFEAVVFLPIPSSFKRAEEAAALAGELRPTGKPDLDNWIKLPMDALEGIAYANDSQVVGFGNSGVWYSDKPRLELHVYHSPPPQAVPPAVELLARLTLETVLSEGQFARALCVDLVEARRILDEVRDTPSSIRFPLYPAKDPA